MSTCLRDCFAINGTPSTFGFATATSTYLHSFLCASMLIALVYSCTIRTVGAVIIAASIAGPPCSLLSRPASSDAREPSQTIG
jgi:hypothetical protein